MRKHGPAGPDSPQQCVLLRPAGLLLLAIVASGILLAGIDSLGLRGQHRKLPFRLFKSSSSSCSRAQQQQQQPAEQELFSTWRIPGVKTCHVEAGADTRICPWCNATFVKQYPLSSQHFQRAYLPGRPCSFPPAVLQKLQSGQPLHISVLGGSWTYGRFCFDGVRNDTACAWPARLQDRLREVYPAANISISNKARPGNHYRPWLAAGDLETVLDGTDIVIIDLQVNSQFYNDPYINMEDADEFIYRLKSAAFAQQRQVGFLFVESFRTCSVAPHDCNRHCPQHRQGQMAYNISGLSAQYSWCNKWWTIATMERPIAQHHGLPIASYRDVVWSSIIQPDPLMPCLWNGLSHADALGHMLFADVVAYAFARSVQDSQRDQQQQLCEVPESKEPAKFHQQAQGRRYCAPNSRPGLYMAAKQPGFTPVAHSGCWSFYEDRPGKPGWICRPGFSGASNSSSSSSSHSDTVAKPSRLLSATATAPLASWQLESLLQQQEAYRNTTGTNITGTNTIWFAVTFSDKPQLQLSYLTTYQNIGSAEVSLFSVDPPAGSSAGGAALAAAGSVMTTAAAAAASSNSSVLAGGWSLARLASYTVDPLVAQKHSVPRTTFWVHASVAGHWKGQSDVHTLPKAVHAGLYLVSVQPAGKGGNSKKFKLLGVMSC